MRRQRGFAAELTAQLLARGFQLTPLPAHPARPCVLAQRVDHGAAHAPLGERLELDTSRVIEAAGRIDEADHPVLDEIPNIDGVGHRCSHAAGKLLDERERGNNAWVGL